MQTAPEQERRWREFVEAVRRGPTRPFAEHWKRFNEIYRGRDEADGPPPAWFPSDERRALSNIGRFIRDRDLADYDALHRWSVTGRESFWSAVIERLGIVLARPPDRILDAVDDPEHARWLPGAELNCVDSCFTAAPDKPAIVSGTEGSSRLELTTYGELERLANRVAGGLRARGFEPGDRIAFYMPMSVACVAAYLGVIRAGCVAVAVADSFSADELARRLELGEARCVFTVDRYRRGGKWIELYRKVREANAPLAVVIPAAVETPEPLRDGDLSWEQLLANDTVFEPVTSQPDTPISVLFSSGTTGTPKAIPWTQLTPIKCAMDGHFHQDIDAGDVVAWPTNIGWMMGPWLIFSTLINDGILALYEGAPTGAGFARFVQDARVTMLGLVPSLARVWRSSGALDGTDWNAVRVFSSTGEPSNREDTLWLMSRNGYRAPVIEYCGGTEIGGGYASGTVVQPACPATFTTAALGLEFVLLDATGGPVGEGEMGEVFLCPPSIGLSQSLLNRDHHEVYHAGVPRGPGGATLRRHGDQLTRLPGGYLRAGGRADDTMNLGGVKVGSLEIEQILDAHPAVQESAAIAVQAGGEGAERLVVFVVRRDASAPIAPRELAQELNAALRGGLNPLFRIHDLVLVERLPRTASNKLMRRSLREQCER